MPLAAGERLSVDEYLPLRGEYPVDIPVVDVLYNAVDSALHVAAAAEASNLNLAVHNCYSPLATLMAAAFCASVPNLHMLELDVDGVPWQNDFVTVPPVVENGHLAIPSGPGWGTAIDEDAAHAG